MRTPLAVATDMTSPRSASISCVFDYQPLIDFATPICDQSFTVRRHELQSYLGRHLWLTGP